MSIGTRSYLKAAEGRQLKKEIVDTIIKMSGKYPPDIIFSDWVQCSALAIQNSCCMLHDQVWNSREEQYKNTMNRYTAAEQKDFARMLALLADAFEEQVSDILGEIYMEAGCGSRHTAQFFTPFHISYLIAEAALAGRKADEDGKYYISEPSVGGGGMIIAAAEILKRQGIDFQQSMRVVAQDLDWRSVYMAYVQFSLLGIDAILIQGDSLADLHPVRNTKQSHILRTPKRMEVIL